jgi:hypothetical protein
MGIDQRTNQPTDGRTNAVSHRGASSRLKIVKSKSTIYLQLAAILKRRGGWDFLPLFKLFSDLTNFLKINGLRMAQMNE